MNTDFVTSGHIHGTSIVGGKIGTGELRPDGHYTFEVNEDGFMRAYEGTFSGYIKSAEISSCEIKTTNGTFSVSPSGFMQCTDGEIAGWKIGNNTISKNGLYLDSNGSIYCKDENGNYKYKIDANGNADFRSANLKIRSTCSISDNGKTYGSWSSYLNDSGLIVNNATVTGLIKANNANIPYIRAYEAVVNNIEGNALFAKYIDIDDIEGVDTTINGAIKTRSVNANSIVVRNGIKIDSKRIDNATLYSDIISKVNSGHIIQAYSITSKEATCGHITYKVNGAKYNFYPITLGGMNVWASKIATW